MLNNVSNRGLLKKKNVDVLNFPRASSTDILTKIDNVLDKKLESIIIHIGTNDLTNDKNLLSNLKNIVSKTNRTSPDTSLSLSNIYKYKENTRLKKFCMQKNIKLLSNDNIKEEHLGIKKLHLNRKGNSIFAKICYDLLE